MRQVPFRAVERIRAINGLVDERVVPRDTDIIRELLAEDGLRTCLSRSGAVTVAVSTNAVLQPLEGLFAPHPFRLPDCYGFRALTMPAETAQRTPVCAHCCSGWHVHRAHSQVRPSACHVVLHGCNSFTPCCNMLSFRRVACTSSCCLRGP